MSDAGISRRGLLVAILTCCSSMLTLHPAALAAEGETIYQCDFDRLEPNLPPEGWTSFTPGTRPDVAVLESGFLKGQR